MLSATPSGSETDEFLWPALPDSKTIVTSHICPPIPFRSMDWCAYFEGEEELGGYGYGATEAEAIADFIGNLDD